ARSDRGLEAAFPRHRAAAPVLDDLDGHLHGDGRTHDAAVRAVADAHADAAANAFGRLDAAREHAGNPAEPDAGRADDALRVGQPGDPVPWCRIRRGLAAVRGDLRNRLRVLRDRAAALSQDDRA